MQIQTNLIERYHLRRKFVGAAQLGNYEMWISLGNYLNFTGGRNYRHQHSYFEACLVLDGKGEFHHGDQIYHVSPGDLFVSDPGIVHEIVSSPDPDQYLKIHFTAFSFEKSFEGGRSASSARVSSAESSADRVSAGIEDRFDRYIDDFLQSHIHVIPGCECLKVYFEQLKHTEEAHDYGDWLVLSQSIIRSLVLEMIIKTLPKVKADSKISINDTYFPSSSAESCVQTDPRLQIGLRYIKDNVGKPLTVQEIAFQAGTSPRTLLRLFKSNFACTVAQKCMEIRIAEAARCLVAHPEAAVGEIGYIYGFENPSDFGRSFRRIMGAAPGEYRKNQGTVFST